MNLTKEQIEQFVEIYNSVDDYPYVRDVADALDISERQVRRRRKSIESLGVSLVQRNNTERAIQEEPDNEVIEQNVRLSKQKQKLQDIQRIERKSFREQARAENVLEELNRELIDIISERAELFKNDTRNTTVSVDSDNVGVVQLSDLHFGEIVSETLDNQFDIDVASKRLRKLSSKCKAYFKSHNITSIAVFLTGDIINSARRISEITTYADARVKVVFNAYLIIGQFLEDLYKDFNLTVASVVGNESRLSEYFDTTDYLVSDNFDLMLHQLLQNTHEKEGMRFLDIHNNPLEQVVDVNGTKFLLVHGNVHKGLATTNKIETEVEKIKSRYAGNGVRVDYVVCGHVHSTYLSNTFSRSASLVGSNAFSERTLNCTSKAAQNVFVVMNDGSVDATMVDLQLCDTYEPYPYDRENIRYFNDKEKGTVVIQSVFV